MFDQILDYLLLKNSDWGSNMVDITMVDRFEVIDNDGRSYVKGSIYGTPVSIELSYQDDGKTLKVFVTDRIVDKPPVAPETKSS